MTKTFRLERDSMGELKVPTDALWGAQTQRAVDNFHISGTPMPAGFIAALALVKQAAARANRRLNLLDGAGEVGNDVLVGMARAGHRRFAFEQRADFVNLRGRIEVEHGDDRPLVRYRVDEPFRFQMPQHLAHHGVAHAENLAERAFD